MTTTTDAAVDAASAATMSIETEPLMLKKRIGSTEYLVTVRYGQTATETIEDKILRMLESEVRQSA